MSKVSAFYIFLLFEDFLKFGLRKDLCFTVIFYKRNWNSWYLRRPGQLYFSNEHILSRLTTSFSSWCVPNKWNSNLSNVSGVSPVTQFTAKGRGTGIYQYLSSLTRGVLEAGVWCSVEHGKIHCKQQKGRVLERMIINDANTNTNLLALYFSPSSAFLERKQSIII